MKKHLNIIIAICICIVLTCSTAIAVNGDSYLAEGGFTYFYNSNGKCVIHSYIGEDTNVVIPKSLAGVEVGEIENYAFLYSSIESIDFSNASSLHKIGASAFTGCDNLKRVELPIWVYQISTSTFQSCASLESVSFYGNLKTIPAQAFYNCPKLDNVVLPESVSSIGNYAFANCIGLSSVYISALTTSISDNAFYNCPNLTIKGKFGSYAEQYAVEHNIPFKGDITHAMGDVNLDGYINIIDATAILKHIVGINYISGESLAVADVDGDESVTVLDATMIQKMIAQII